MRSLFLIGLLAAGILALISTAAGFVHNVIGTPFLYAPTQYTPISPSQLEENARNYQKIFGYRGIKFLENINQENVEHNPKLYDKLYLAPGSSTK